MLIVFRLFCFFRKEEYTLNFQSLLYFKTVAELQHLTKATNRLYVTQPALSKSLQKLEKELGCKLFERSGRNIILTKFGLHFYPYVKNALENINMGINDIHRLRESENGIIHISSLPSTFRYYITLKMKQFQISHPHCKFSVEYKFTSAVINDVMSGNSELGICSELYNTKILEHVEYKHLYEEPVCFITSQTTDLGKKIHVSEEEISGYPFVAYHISNLGTNHIYETICHKYGKTPNYIIEAYNDIGVINAVIVNNAIAIIPSYNIINYNFGDLVKLSVNTNMPLKRNVNLVWPKEHQLDDTVMDFKNSLLKDSHLVNL